MSLHQFIADHKQSISKAFEEECCYYEYKLHYSSHETLDMVVEKVQEALELLGRNEREGVVEVFREYARLNIELKVPFISSLNQLNNLRNSIVHLMLEEHASKEIVDMCVQFDEIINTVSYCYFLDFIQDLKRRNKIRTVGFEALVDYSVIEHFEQHMLWIDELVAYIENLGKTSVPETDPTLCRFGKWFCSKGERVVGDDHLVKEIHEVHNELHHIAEIIVQVVSSKVLDYQKLLTYMQKAEYLSLSLGSSLALINNIITIAESNKDPLTGANFEHRRRWIQERLEWWAERRREAEQASSGGDAAGSDDASESGRATEPENPPESDGVAGGT